MQKILILDFGGQYNQLIARRVRECRVYCEVKPYTMTMAEIRAFAPMGIIFTGGPNSVYLEESPQAARSPQRRWILLENMEKPTPSTTPPVPSSRACLRRGSAG